MPSPIRIRAISNVLCSLLATVFLHAASPVNAQSVIDSLPLSPEEVKEAGLEGALRALNEGDYETAYSEAMPLAKQGNKTAVLIAGMAELKIEIDRREKERLAATGPIDLRDYDARYRSRRSAADQEQFAKGTRFFEAQEFEAAFQEWLTLADAGDAEALYEIAQLYSRGKGVEESKNQSDVYLLKSAQQGYGAAQGDLAASDIFGLSKDESVQRESFYWGIRAAANGHFDGYQVLSYAYCDGAGVDRNPVLADIWRYMIFPKKEDFLRHACNDEIDFPTPYYKAIAERAEAMSKAYDIPMVPQD